MDIDDLEDMVELFSLVLQRTDVHRSYVSFTVEELEHTDHAHIRALSRSSPSGVKRHLARPDTIDVIRYTYSTP
jgi:hypothetical protein